MNNGPGTADLDPDSGGTAMPGQSSMGEGLPALRTVAATLAERYRSAAPVAAAVLAGSVGRGRADRHSDVELDVYWRRPPTDEQRRSPVLELGGSVIRLWPYDRDEAEWSDDVELAGTPITISGFTTADIDNMIGAVVGGNCDVVKQMRVSALHEGTVLFGDGTVRRWRDQAVYTRKLSISMIDHSLDPARIGRWRHWQALSRRGDLVLLRRVCSDVADAMLGALCGVNRIFVEHPRFKWSRELVARFTQAPPDFESRFFQALDSDAASCAAELSLLLGSVIELVEHSVPEASTVPIRELLATLR